MSDAEEMQRPALELLREKRIREIRAKMESMGLIDLAQNLMGKETKAPPRKAGGARKKAKIRGPQELRRSRRLQGLQPAAGEIAAAQIDSQQNMELDQAARSEQGTVGDRAGDNDADAHPELPPLHKAWLEGTPDKFGFLARLEKLPPLPPGEIADPEHLASARLLGAEFLLKAGELRCGRYRREFRQKVAALELLANRPGIVQWGAVLPEWIYGAAALSSDTDTREVLRSLSRPRGLRGGPHATTLRKQHADIIKTLERRAAAVLATQTTFMGYNMSGMDLDALSGCFTGNTTTGECTRKLRDYTEYYAWAREQRENGKSYDAAEIKSADPQKRRQRLGGLKIFQLAKDFFRGDFQVNHPEALAFVDGSRTSSPQRVRGGVDGRLVDEAIRSPCPTTSWSEK
ncbi:unnamed protein product [Pedinophyceae sp. YPF-701]|nr:unnamed protein product [Pedinophyceae sp. YPF-701]